LPWAVDRTPEGRQAVGDATSAAATVWSYGSLEEAMDMDGVSELEQTAFGGDNRKWWTLAAVSLGLFMIMLDNTVVNVALPSVERDLGMSLSQLD